MYKFVNEYIRDHYMSYGLSTEEAIQIDVMYAKIAVESAKLTSNQLHLLGEVLGDL